MDQQLLVALVLVAGVAAFGGLVGGVVAGRRATVVSSILMGIIGGMVTSVLVREFGGPPIVGTQGYSLVYALGAGFLFSWVIGSTRG